MEIVYECISQMNSKGFTDVWYQNLGDDKFNIGCGFLIHYKVECGKIIWKLHQYG